MNLYHYVSPPNFYRLAGQIVPWAAWSAAILGVCGLYIGFFVAPTDSLFQSRYEPGEP